MRFIKRCALLVLVISGLLLLSRLPKTVSGRVVDCETQSPIEGATVTAHQQGWGFNDYLVWDKDYSTSTQSDKDGSFKIVYSVGDSANLTVEKSGYIKAQQYEEPKKGIVIKLRAGPKDAETTYHCRLLSGCLVTTNENGVQVTRNTCAP